MSIVYSNVSNEKYTVCCAGQLVYIYEKSGRELGRFTLPGAEFAAISPAGDVFAVKTKSGCVALYSFAPLEQIKILKDEDEISESEKGMCFSADGQKLYNIEQSDRGGCVTAYNMNGREKEIICFENAVLGHVEYDGDLFVMGKEDDNFFSAKLDDDKNADVKYVSAEDFCFCDKYKRAQVRGFSATAAEKYLPEVRDLSEVSATVADLWKKGE